MKDCFDERLFINLFLIYLINLRSTKVFFHPKPVSPAGVYTLSDSGLFFTTSFIFATNLIYDISQCCEISHNLDSNIYRDISLCCDASFYCEIILYSATSLNLNTCLLSRLQSFETSIYRNAGLYFDSSLFHNISRYYNPSLYINISHGCDIGLYCNISHISATQHNPLNPPNPYNPLFI